MRKRSSCDSGSGKVPTCSCGFCVAITKNGSGSGMDLAVERHLPLLHGLEQRALRLGRGAVDLIGEHELREDRAALEAELAGLALEDGHAEHVRGQQIAGELHPLERQAQRAGEGVGERGLADARDVLDQQVPARQQAGEAQADLLLLAENDAVDLREDCVDVSGALRRCRARRRFMRRAIAFTRAICAASWPISARSSARRARSLATTSAGAFLAKSPLASLAWSFSKSAFGAAAALGQAARARPSDR